jgi:large subunit ribosomal protein L31
MKKEIHPKTYQDAVVTCVCGNSFVTQSTLENISVDICSKCHPLYTGKQKFVDTEGRIDKFKKKMEFAKENQSKSKRKTANKKGQNVVDSKSLKDLLKETK